MRLTCGLARPWQPGRDEEERRTGRPEPPANLLRSGRRCTIVGDWFVAILQTGESTWASPRRRAGIALGTMRLGAARWRVLTSSLMLVSGGALLGAAVAAPTRGTGGAAQQRDGGTLRIAATTFDSVDPAISGFGWVDLATCALLVRYPDKPPPEGNRVVPELAAGYPSVSPDARRYTFRIRRGFRFSTGGRITGVNLAYAIDRVLRPTLHPEGGASIEDIVGASAVEAGRAKHAVGVKVSGNTLTIRLTKPVGDFLARLTSPYFCP